MTPLLPYTYLIFKFCIKYVFLCNT